MVMSSPPAVTTKLVLTRSVPVTVNWNVGASAGTESSVSLRKTGRNEESRFTVMPGPTDFTT